VGGVVGNPPCTGTTACMGDIINLLGGTPPTANTLTFSSPITNPVFAVWSLGSQSTPATLTFAPGATPIIQSTGTSGFGFVSLTASGNAVTGVEGNGTFLLPGTFSSIPFTASFENFYGFTVGSAGALVGAVPEPSTYALLAAGLAMSGLFGRRRKAKSRGGRPLGSVIRWQQGGLCPPLYRPASSGTTTDCHHP
jgi:hypothetical protein